MPTTFEKLKQSFTWKLIFGCPGRFVLRGHEPDLTVQNLAGEEIITQTFKVAAAKDPVIVAAINGGGIISYAKPDGTFVHTLNTEEGFRRKLDQLGIDISPSKSF